MKKSIQALIIISLSILCTSCLEVLEDISVNNDGSGKYNLIINLSQSKNQLDKLMSQDSIRGFAVPDNGLIETEISKLITEFNSQDGISNASKEIDFHNYIFKLSFEFQKIENLNNGINKLLKAKNPNTYTDNVLYGFENSEFTRKINANLIKSVNTELEKVSAIITDFEKATLTSIMRFESEIKETNHHNAKISSNGKNCFEQVKIIDLLQNKELHQQLIKIKK